MTASIDAAVERVLPILDSSLQVSRPHKRRHSLGVYEVVSGDERYILKVNMGYNKIFGRKELSCLGRIKGVPRTPQLIDFYDDGDVLCILKSMAPGSNLEEYMAQGGIIRPSFYPSALEVVDEIHARGVYYLDLHKPENVVVGREGVWLFDFDCVKSHPIDLSSEKIEREKSRDINYLKKYLKIN